METLLVLSSSVTPLLAHGCMQSQCSSHGVPMDHGVLMDHPSGQLSDRALAEPEKSALKWNFNIRFPTQKNCTLLNLLSYVRGRWDGRVQEELKQFLSRQLETIKKNKFPGQLLFEEYLHQSFRSFPITPSQFNLRNVISDWRLPLYLILFCAGRAWVQFLWPYGEV